MKKSFKSGDDIEVWKTIKGIEHLYKVSNMGNVKSFLRNTQDGYMLKLTHDKDGYLLVSLGRKYRVKVHRLVMQTFVENPSNKSDVNHINGIKDDNRVENLEWSSHSENQLHSFRIGLNKNIGTNHYYNLLSEEDVVNIFKKSHTLKIPRSVLSKEYGVSHGCISNIVYRKTWKIVTANIKF